LRHQRTRELPLIRMTLTQDECSVGWSLALWLVERHGAALLPVRDPLHRLMNFADLGLTWASETMKATKTLTHKLFKLSRGPWNSHRHGRQLRDSGHALFYSVSEKLLSKCVFAALGSRCSSYCVVSEPPSCCLPVAIGPSRSLDMCPDSNTLNACHTFCRGVDI
jgi:hypothetical protein